MTEIRRKFIEPGMPLQDARPGDLWPASADGLRWYLIDRVVLDHDHVTLKLYAESVSRDDVTEGRI